MAAYAAKLYQLILQVQAFLISSNSSEEVQCSLHSLRGGISFPNEIYLPNKYDATLAALTFFLDDLGMIRCYLQVYYLT